MKASELMIGDLVSVNEDPQRVIQIGKAGCTVLPADYPYFEKRLRSTERDKTLMLLGLGTDTIGYYRESEIQPILLSEKILKANKLEKVEDWDDLYRIKGDVCYDYEHQSMVMLIYDLLRPICDVITVDEMQRFLRSLGENMLACNFKLE